MLSTHYHKSQYEHTADPGFNGKISFDENLHWAELLQNYLGQNEWQSAIK